MAKQKQLTVEQALATQTLEFKQSGGRGWGVQCKQIKRDGNRCKKWAITGGYVCRKHGGALPSVREAASLRWERMLPLATEAVAALLGPDVKPDVRLRAARFVLRTAFQLEAKRVGAPASERKALPQGQGTPDDEIEALLGRLVSDPSLRE